MDTLAYLAYKKLSEKTHRFCFFHSQNYKFKLCQFVQAHKFTYSYVISYLMLILKGEALHTQ
jgi:hypothetical protein